MPGPKSTPTATNYRDKAKPNRKGAARLKARQDDYDDMMKKANAFPGEFTKPGSQNRRK